jgi:hypothetical protein
MVAGASVFFAFMAMARLFLRHDLEELIRVMPGPVGRLIQRALLLSRPAAA